MIWKHQRKKNDEKGNRPTPFVQTYLHGTNIELHLGDLITVGFPSNYAPDVKGKYIFLTVTLDAAIWGAE